VTLCDFSAVPTCYAELIGRVRQKQPYRGVELCAFSK
jgi:hypothetical protein